MLDLIQTGGSPFSLAQLVLLLAVVLVPFPVSPLGQHLRNPIAARSHLAAHGCAVAPGCPWEKERLRTETDSHHDGTRIESRPRWPNSDIEPGQPPDALALQVRRGTRGRHISGGRVKDFHPLFTRTNDVLAKGGEAACSVALWLV
jgi:hypothetical protein